MPLRASALVDEVVVNDERWPLIVTRYPRRIVDPFGFLRSFEEGLERALASRRHAVWFHLGDLGATALYRANAVERRTFADMLNRIFEDYGRPHSAATVVNGEVTRLLAVGISFLLKKKELHRRFFSNVHEAQAWLLSEAAQAGHAFEPHVF